jgi:osmotically inducible protein OsmC
MKGSSGAFEVPFSFRTRFEEEPGTNPEELIGSALAGCFSMYLAAQLTNAGFPPDEIRTTAKVHLEAGPQITLIELETEARVVNIDEATFQEKVNVSKEKCPISMAVSGPEKRVTARLLD